MIIYCPKPNPFLRPPTFCSPLSPPHYTKTKYQQKRQWKQNEEWMLQCRRLSTQESLARCPVRSKATTTQKPQRWSVAHLCITSRRVYFVYGGSCARMGFVTTDPFLGRSTRSALRTCSHRWMLLLFENTARDNCVENREREGRQTSENSKYWQLRGGAKNNNFLLWCKILLYDYLVQDATKPFYW